MHDSGTVSLAPTAGDPLAAGSDERLHRLLAYLEARRGTREFAARRDIDPLDFGYILGNIVLLDVQHEPVRFRYRLIGSIITARLGYDLTGTFVDAHPDVEYRGYVAARYAETVASRRPTGGSYSFVMDRKLRQCQCLRVPLSDDGKTIDKIIAAFILTAPPPAR